MKTILLSMVLFFTSVVFAAPDLSQSGLRHVIVSGFVASGNASDDVWVGDSSYPFQSSAVLTYASSSSANDAAAGTGCRTALVEGVDSSYNYLSETVTLDGTTSVALTGSYLAINQVKCVTVGSGGVNAGTVLVGAYNTSLANMPANYGVSQAAVYTVPANKRSSLLSWGFSVGASTTGQAAVQLQIQENGKSWRVLDTATANDSSGKVNPMSGAAIFLPAKAQVRLRILSIGTLLAAGVRVNGNLEIGQK